jgi:hypothetical protein
MISRRMPPREQSPPEDAGVWSARRALPPQALQALAEAAARRRARAEAERAEAGRSEALRPREIDGRGGLDPARFGDWEVKGIASDF